MTPPKLKQFHLFNHEGLPPVAPGLDAVIEVSYIASTRSTPANPSAATPAASASCCLTSHQLRSSAPQCTSSCLKVPLSHFATLPPCSHTADRRRKEAGKHFKQFFYYCCEVMWTRAPRPSNPLNSQVEFYLPAAEETGPGGPGGADGGG